MKVSFFFFLGHYSCLRVKSIISYYALRKNLPIQELIVDSIVKTYKERNNILDDSQNLGIMLETDEDLKDGDKIFKAACKIKNAIKNT